MDGEEKRTPETAIASRWEDVLSLYHEFKVCRFSLIVAVIGAFVFLYVAQGVELLRSLGEESTLHILGSGPAAGVKWLAIVLGALTWSLASWYACRVLLSFDFSSPRQSDKQPGTWWKWLGPRLRTYLPRILGLAPLLIMALGFWHASSTYTAADADPPRWLRVYAGSCVLIAAGLYLFFVYRPYQGRVPASERRVGIKRNLGELDGSTKIALGAMILISLLLLVLFAFNPIVFAGDIGAGAVLLFAAAFWVFWGSTAVYIAAKYRIPVLTIAVVWAALCSLWNDNHIVRTSPPSPLNRQKTDAAFEAWHQNMAKYASESVHPLFIVATEGGGIRAAYWTATVLGELEDRAATAHLPDFAEHVFAISAVSGGSLGAAVFDAALAGGSTGPITLRMQQMLGEDFLAPPLAAMLYPDLLQRFLPFPLPALDRGQWLERAWEKAGQRHLGNDRFARNFNALWEHPGTGYLPALFLNGTSVETGQRIIASNFLIDNRFLDSIDAAAKVGDHRHCDIPLSTAAHGSARFTYVSPAGRFLDGTHIVDGGYFENSGSTTALEVLRAVEDTISTRGLHDVRPYVILISNDPLSAPSGGRDLTNTTPSDKLEQDKHRPSPFLEDTLAPVLALANSRGAHDSYAQLALREAQGYQNTAYFGLSPSPIPLPLGWKLSGTAAQAMNRQAQVSCAKIDGKDNPSTFKEILNLLNGSTAITPYGPKSAPVP